MISPGWMDERELVLVFLVVILFGFMGLIVEFREDEHEERMAGRENPDDTANLEASNPVEGFPEKPGASLANDRSGGEPKEAARHIM